MSVTREIGRALIGVFCGFLAAAIGIVAAVWLSMNFMVVKVEGSSMLPALEPGQRVLAARFDREFSVGDLVVCRTECYDIDGQGSCSIKRVAGIKEDMIKVRSDADFDEADTEIISSERVLGKVIKYG